MPKACLLFLALLFAALSQAQDAYYYTHELDYFCNPHSLSLRELYKKQAVRSFIIYRLGESDSQVWRQAFLDEEGKLQKLQTLDEILHYRYDKEGRLRYVHAYHLENPQQLSSIRTCTYNAQGRLLEQMTIRLDVEQNAYAQHSVWAYDKAGRVKTIKSTHEAQSEVEGPATWGHDPATTRFTYDAQGRIKTLHADLVAMFLRWDLEYNAQGQLKKMAYFPADIHDQTWQFSYDEKGLPRRILQEESAGAAEFEIHYP